MKSKRKSLEPYQEHLQNLVAEKQFADELVHFSVDEQSTVLAEEHRADVIPLLMRILDGKMHARVTKKGFSKRPAIFRFVAGCRPEELETFLNTVFAALDCSDRKSTS